jgi:RNA polymerase sigma-70 factor (ECF subfamily)
VDPGSEALEDLAAPDGSDHFDETRHREYLVQRALELIQEDFQPTTWQAWREYAVGGRPAAEVAADLGITPHAVYLAKARVLQRLRQEISGFLDE